MQGPLSPRNVTPLASDTPSSSTASVLVSQSSKTSTRRSTSRVTVPMTVEPLVMAPMLLPMSMSMPPVTPARLALMAENCQLRSCDALIRRSSALKVSLRIAEGSAW